MKKVIGIIVCVILLIAIIAVVNMEHNGGSNSNELVKIANPLTEVASLEEMQKYFDVQIPALNKDVDAYIVIGIWENAEHARIKYSDNTSFEMQLGKDEDASGIYGGKLDREMQLNNVDVKFFTYEGPEETINYANWSSNVASYSYQSIGKAIDVMELSELVENTK